MRFLALHLRTLHLFLILDISSRRLAGSSLIICSGWDDRRDVDLIKLVFLLGYVATEFSPMYVWLLTLRLNKLTIVTRVTSTKRWDERSNLTSHKAVSLHPYKILHVPFDIRHYPIDEHLYASRRVLVTMRSRIICQSQSFVRFCPWKDAEILWNPIARILLWNSMCTVSP